MQRIAWFSSFPFIFLVSSQWIFTKFFQLQKNSVPPFPWNCWKAALFSLPVLGIQSSSKVAVFAAPAHKIHLQKLMKFPPFKIDLTWPNSIANFCSTLPFGWGILWSIHSKEKQFHFLHSTLNAWFLLALSHPIFLIWTLYFAINSFINLQKIISCLNSILSSQTFFSCWTHIDKMLLSGNSWVFINSLGYICSLSFSSSTGFAWLKNKCYHHIHFFCIILAVVSNECPNNSCDTFTFTYLLQLVFDNCVN